jgi:hypothetical protein
LTLTPRRMKATLACGFAHATCGSPPSINLSFRAKLRNADESAFKIATGSFDFAALRSG